MVRHDCRCFTAPAALELYCHVFDLGERECLREREIKKENYCQDSDLGERKRVKERRRETEGQRIALHRV